MNFVELTSDGNSVQVETNIKNESILKDIEVLKEMLAELHEQLEEVANLEEIKQLEAERNSEVMSNNNNSPIETSNIGKKRGPYKKRTNVAGNYEIYKDEVDLPLDKMKPGEAFNVPDKDLSNYKVQNRVYGYNKDKGWAFRTRYIKERGYTKVSRIS